MERGASRRRGAKPKSKQLADRPTQAFKNALGDDYAALGPARTTVAIRQLPNPDHKLLIEIKSTAVLPQHL